MVLKQASSLLQTDLCAGQRWLDAGVSAIVLTSRSACGPPETPAESGIEKFRPEVRALTPQGSPDD